jgi:hypothetical protein
MGLRSKGGREPQVSSSAPVAGTPVNGASLPSTHDPSVDGDGTEADELLTRARRFAEAVGIAGVVHPEPQSVAGLRIASLADVEAEHPARHRAWCLLAGLLGQLEPDAAPSNAAAPAFLQWLVDPDDQGTRSGGAYSHARPALSLRLVGACGRRVTLSRTGPEALSGIEITRSCTIT